MTQTKLCPEIAVFVIVSKAINSILPEKNDSINTCGIHNQKLY